MPELADSTLPTPTRNLPPPDYREGGDEPLLPGGLCGAWLCLLLWASTCLTVIWWVP